MMTLAPVADTDARFRSLFENTPELILYQNEASIILDANPAFLTLVGKPKEQVVNHPYDEFLPADVRGLFREKLAEAFTGKIVRFEVYAAQGNSAPRHWDVVKVPVREDNRVVGVHMVARDITEKNQHEQEIFAQNKDLQQFTYIVSHNLRAPLANALGMVDLLALEQADTPKFEQAQAYLKTSLHQLDQVLLDINTILAIRDKVGLANSEAVPLAEVVEQVRQSLQDVLHDCGGTLRTTIPTGFQVRGNRAYLYSIVFNLLSNAIKYRDAHRPLLVELTATEGAGQSQEIVVADSGLGIDLAHAGADVFKLYQRFHPQHPGRGVGLYLTKTHVESMGGHIAVSSEVGKGTQFTITLP
ncbi:sensor histidine kinase [Hymenobacter sp. IS2118]|uniref:sensor histidine kinase n=1 Tax=Hymenobacter sp. IS2118 TaxID=1505605 RepID=UPI0009DE6AC5|nr:PAS domain-containing sensor histidine kinase [Hymenobacter sp. IS2118]